MESRTTGNPLICSGEKPEIFHTLMSSMATQERLVMAALPIHSMFKLDLSMNSLLNVDLEGYQWVITFFKDQM